MTCNGVPRPLEALSDEALEGVSGGISGEPAPVRKGKFEPLLLTLHSRSR